MAVDISCMALKQTNLKVAVIIPCYRVKKHILKVIENIPKNVVKIYAVNDACPDGTGEFINQYCKDARVNVLNNDKNLGVGGAMIRGYQAAIKDKIDICVKIDGDGQMDASLIEKFIAPIIAGQADYTKGNRFFNLEALRQMPLARLFGNASLSFLSKFSTGYWNIFDPTNGFTAIHMKTAAILPFEKISNRYFFESDMLFRLNTLRAVVRDIPMTAVYGDEKSNLKISKIITEFMLKHLRNSAKRLFYNYFLRDFSIASVQLIVGLILLLFGVIFGALSWYEAEITKTFTSTGTVMLAALPLIVGLQLTLAFLAFDMSTVPTDALHPDLVE